MGDRDRAYAGGGEGEKCILGRGGQRKVSPIKTGGPASISISACVKKKRGRPCKGGEGERSSAGGRVGERLWRRGKGKQEA